MTTPTLTRDERTAALYLLRLAHQYIAKANEQGAYAGCVLSGDTVLRRMDAGIEALHGAPATADAHEQQEAA